MHPRLIVQFGLVAASAFSFADGLPFNQEKTHLLCKIETLKLTPQQQIEVSRTRVLKLSKSQRSKLQQLAKECPAVLQVLTNRYDDCTCGMSSYAVWFGKNEVEVPVWALPTQAMTKEEMEDFGIEVPTPPEILVDERLEIWLKGKKVSEKRLLETLEKWKNSPPKAHLRNESGQLQIIVETPPKMFGETEERLSQFVTRLRAFTSKQNIDLFVCGFRAEGQ